MQNQAFFLLRICKTYVRFVYKQTHFDKIIKKNSKDIRFLCQNCCNLRAFLGVKFSLKVLLHVKELIFRNSAYVVHCTIKMKQEIGINLGEFICNSLEIHLSSRIFKPKRICEKQNLNMTDFVTYIYLIHRTFSTLFCVKRNV